MHCFAREQCICFKFQVKLGTSGTETFEMLREGFREYSSSQTVVLERVSSFKDGQASLEDDKGSG
jgi:hypothetical protein